MDYLQLTSHLLKEFRGPRTQKQMSRVFGYPYNQYGKWESNQRKIRWREFAKLCQISNIQLERTLAHSLKFALRVFDPNSASEIIHQFLLIQGMEDRNVIARRLRIQSGALDRLLSGSVDPSLERVFQIMDLFPGFLDLFLKRLLETKPGFEPVAEPQNLAQLQLQYITQYPWALAVIAALETVHFKEFFFHRLKELADFISLDPGILAQSLNELTRLKILTKKPDRYEVSKVAFDTGNLPMKEILKPIHYWTEKVAQRIAARIALLEGGKVDLEELPGIVYFSDYRVLSLPSAARDEINQLIANFVGQIKTIAQNQKGPKDQVSCFVLHHFQPGILPTDNRFEDHWLSRRPESLYWAKKFNESL
jgi:transcriptional regulator with XRE-family HTH domain